MWEKLKGRLRSKTLWVAVASLVLLILHQLNVNVVDEQYNKIVEAVLYVAVLAGIIDGEK